MEPLPKSPASGWRFATKLKMRAVCPIKELLSVNRQPMAGRFRIGMTSFPSVSPIIVRFYQRQKLFQSVLITFTKPRRSIGANIRCATISRRTFITIRRRCRTTLPRRCLRQAMLSKRSLCLRMNTFWTSSMWRK